MPYNYDIEPALEGALVSLLQAQGIVAGASLTTDELTTPRVDVQFQLGAELPARPANGVSNTYEGSFILTVITDRDRNNGSHSSFRSTVRRIMSETTGAAWSAVLGTSFLLLSCDHAGTAYNVLDSNKALDASVMSYSAVVRLVSN